jgi:hypothetical protein
MPCTDVPSLLALSFPAICWLLLLQVRAVPIRKDDEVQVVRGTFKVRPGHKNTAAVAPHAASLQVAGAL